MRTSPLESESKPRITKKSKTPKPVRDVDAAHVLEGVAEDERPLLVEERAPHDGDAQRQVPGPDRHAGGDIARGRLGGGRRFHFDRRLEAGRVLLRARRLLGGRGGAGGGRDDEAGPSTNECAL